MKDIVVVSLEPWDEIWRRNQHLTDGILREYPDVRMLFVEPSTDPLHDIRLGQIPRRGYGLRRASGTDYDDRLWLSTHTKWLPRRVRPTFDDDWARAIVTDAERTGMLHPVLWANDPAAARIRDLRNWWTLYDITDDWLSAHRPHREQARLAADEEALLAKADEVVVCSAELARRKQRGRPIHLIPNAVDPRPYLRRLPRPPDLPDGRCAVYVGTLHRDRLDLDLCVETAAALNDDQHLCLVGPVALPPVDRKLLAGNRIHLLGQKSHEDIPRYLQHADVLVLPHVQDAFTDSLDPIKRYEYAASGRPTVASPVAGFTNGIDGVRVARADRFPYAVRDLLIDPLPDRAMTDVPTWLDRVAAVTRLLPW